MAKKTKVNEAQSKKGRPDLELLTLLNFALDHVFEVVFLVDEHARICYVNESACRILQYSRKELLAMTVSDIDPDYPPERWREHWMNTSSLGSLVRESCLRKKDGMVFPVEESINYSEQHGRGYRLCLARDITGRREAETALRQREAHLRFLSENLAEGMVYQIDSGLDGKQRLFTYLSPAVEKFHGLKPADVLQKPLLLYDQIVEEDRLFVAEREAAAFSARTRFEADVRVLLPSGEIRWRRFISSPRISAEGAILWDGIEIDITDRKKTEEALLKSESRIRSIIESNPVGMHMYSMDSAGRLVFTGANPAADRILGVDNRVFIGKTIEEAFPALKETDIPRRYREVLTSGKMWKAENIEYQDNIIKGAFEVHAFRTGPDTMVAAFEEITERKRSEMALKESEAKYRRLYNETPVLLHSIDRDAVLVEVNDYWLKTLGYERDEVIGRKVTDFYTGASRKYAEEVIFPAFFRDGIASDIPYQLIKKNGDVVDVILSATGERNEDGGIVGSQAVIVDVTELKRVQEALRESESQFRRLVEDSPIAILIIDRSGRIEYINKKHTEIVGYLVEEIPTLDVWWESVYTDTEIRKQVMNAWGGIIQRILRGDVVGPIERTIVCKDGSSKDVEMRFSLAGEKIFAVFADISERKQAEEALRRSEERFRDLAEFLPLTVFEADLQGRFTYVNNAALETFGYDREDVEVGLNISQVLAPEDRARAQTAIARRLSGQTDGYIEYQGLRKDGIKFPITVASTPIMRNGRPFGLRGIVTDLTERKRLEHEQLKAQRLESIGTLAGGIAHDFNNLLQGVFGYISMAKIYMDQKAKALTMLEQAEKALHQSVSLTTQLLTFSKGGKPVKRVFDLGPVIENAVKFALSGSRSDFCLEISEDLLGADADEGQIAQVIQNIVINADQAMPLGGTVHITARNIPSSDLSREGLSGSVTYIELAIRDTGVGIPKEYVASIFDPYFTTKEKGSGIGLATSYSIINNHGGLIDVQSEVGKGTTFFIYLPGITREGKLPEAPKASPPVRSGRVLVMDDDQVIMTLAGEMLKALDHEAVCVSHGQAAITEYESAMDSGQPYDIVILDLTVRGGMGGEETLQRLLEIAPGIKAVVSSGYSEGSVMSNYAMHGFAASLEKPYRLEQLRLVLNRLLE